MTSEPLVPRSIEPSGATSIERRPGDKVTIDLRSYVFCAENYWFQMITLPSLPPVTKVLPWPFSTAQIASECCLIGF